MEILNNVDITGRCQHGFKKKRGTAIAGLQLQSLISRALDDDEYVAMASLDLSAAFGVVNVPLLIKRLKILGLKVSFWGLFKTNFYGHFRKLFLFTKFSFSKFREKVFLKYT